MRRCAAVIIAAGSMFLSGGAGAEPAKCNLREIGELDVSPGRGVATTNVELNGQPARMVIDTGSFATSLFRPAVDKLGLRTKVIDHMRVYGIGGEVGMGEVRLKQFKVGTIVAPDIDLAVIGGNPGDLAGLLGIQFLRQSDVEFDYPEGKVRFFKSENCPGDSVVYWGKAYSVAPIRSNSTLGIIEVEVSLSGQKIVAEMDSGFGATTVATVLADRLSSEASEKLNGRLHGIGAGTLDVANTRFDSFSFGDETIRNAKLDVADLARNEKEVRLGSRIAEAAVDQPEIMLGADFFRSHRIYISKSQNKVYVSYMGGPVFSTRSAETTKPTTASTAP